MLEHKAVGELLFFGGGFTIAKVFNFFASQADNLVVGRWLGAAALGVYAHAYQLMASPATLFGQALDRVLFPTMAIVQNEPARLSRAYRTGVFACAIVMLPMGALIALLAPEIVLILLGPNWTQAAVPLQVLAYGLLFRTSYKISDTVARATGRVYARAWRQAIFASAIFFGALIGQNWGLAGVAWGVVSALALNFMMMAHLSLQSTDIGWREFGAAHIPGLVLAAVVGGACSISTYALRDIDAGALAVVFSALVVGVLLVIMLVCLWPSFFLGPDRAQILRALSGVGPSRLQRGVAFFERRISR